MHTSRAVLLLRAAEAKLVLENTVKLSDVSDPTFYDVVFVPGGHGPVYDLAESDLLGDVLTKAAAAGEGWTADLFSDPDPSACCLDFKRIESACGSLQQTWRSTISYFVYSSHCVQGADRLLHALIVLQVGSKASGMFVL